MIYGVLDKDGENDVGQLAGSAATGAPIGTWASFEKDYAPNIEWLQAGTTFNENTYPALAMYLGGNTIPERYDHSRLGEEETPESSTVPQTPETALVMPYDGIIRIAFGYQNTYLYISSDNGATWQSHQYWQSNGGSYTINIPFEVHKGDKVYCSNSSTTAFMNVQWYKHPMFIKATPTSADSDYEGVLNGIRTYVRNSNSYSIEEQPTGGYWIDGKPIYRMCGNATGSIVFNAGDDPKTVPISWFNTNIKSDVDKIIEVKTAQEGIGLACFWRQPIINTTGISLFYNGSRGYGINSNTLFCIEYTKTV